MKAKFFLAVAAVVALTASPALARGERHGGGHHRDRGHSGVSINVGGGGYYGGGYRGYDYRPQAPYYNNSYYYDDSYYYDQRRRYREPRYYDNDRHHRRDRDVHHRDYRRSH